GEITPADLPQYWDELMQKYLNLSTKGNYKNGVMQDVHWTIGAFGYFPAYSLGRLIGAQIFAAFIKDHPQFFNEIKQGNFSTLVQWLKQHVYSQAAFLPTQDLLVKITGETLDPSYFIRLFD
ncbi:MAG TPA: carboxypeptidase M32, partial [Gammaproteobacteria bacterium]|nr:carboxypeptidase M32 [Gammaproteobacteria bacterium]